MARPSKVTRLPREIQDRIARLREMGHTIDQILAHLAEMDVAPEEMPSRSGLAVAVQKIDRALEMVQSSRAAAEAMMPRLEEAKEGRTARASIELLQSLTFQVLMAAASDGGGSIKMSAKDAGFYAKALADMTRAQRTDVETTLKLRKLWKDELEQNLKTVEAEAEAEKLTPAQMVARIRALYAGEG
jgi:DNA-binding transcriptional MerR regulator